jgi:hypothetical protein
MGYSIAWFAVRGKSQADVLAHLNLRKTMRQMAVPDAPLCSLTLPGRWFLIHMQDWLHPFLAPANFRALSIDCELAGCQVEEHMMISCAFRYVNGARTWNIVHKLDRGPELRPNRWSLLGNS